eukprot:4929751-Alexandrium_andersonii.AAC.1
MTRLRRSRASSTTATCAFTTARLRSPHTLRSATGSLRGTARRRRGPTSPGQGLCLRQGLQRLRRRRRTSSP